jgi:hypothetical protein
MATAGLDHLVLPARGLTCVVIAEATPMRCAPEVREGQWALGEAAMARGGCDPSDAPW